MQRTFRTSIPPNNKNNTQNATANSSLQNDSPAFLLALRIKNEQGATKATEFLLAMEPYLAPAERFHISSRLGLKCSFNGSGNQNSSYTSQNSRQKNTQDRNDGENFTAQQGYGFNMPSGFASMNMNPLNIINMLSGMNAMQKNGSNSFDPALISKLMGLMGKK